MCGEVDNGPSLCSSWETRHGNKDGSCTELDIPVSSASSGAFLTNSLMFSVTQAVLLFEQ